MIATIAPTSLELTERERNAAQVPTQREADSMLLLFSRGEPFTVEQFKDALGGVRYATARRFIFDAHRRGIVEPFAAATAGPNYNGQWMRPERKARR